MNECLSTSSAVAPSIGAYSSGDNQHAADMRDGETREGCCLSERCLMVREPFKRFGRQDKRSGGGLPHLIPYPYISLFSNPALQHLGWLLIASRFSKDHSLSRGSIPRLCLILFCTVVAAQKLIKEHLISITCCQ